MPGLIIMTGKKDGPPPAPNKGAAKKNAPPPRPGAQDPPPAGDGSGEPDADDQALTPDEVGYGEADLCQDCANMGDDGSCTKYNFPVSPTGHCLRGYSPKNGAGAGNEPDADDQGAQQQ